MAKKPPPKQGEDERIQVGVRLPKPLVKDAKVRAVQDETTLNAIVENALREWLRKKN